MKHLRTLVLAGAAVVALSVPAAASAATGTSDVSGTVGSELSVSAPNAALSSFTPSTDGNGSTLVTVSSTSDEWSLTLHDATELTAGQMDRVNCGTRVPTTGSLAGALGYSASGGSGSLSAAPASIRTGASYETVSVSFTQGIGATEDVVAGDCYEVQATFTAT